MDDTRPSQLSTSISGCRILIPDKVLPPNFFRMNSATKAEVIAYYQLILAGIAFILVSYIFNIEIFALIGAILAFLSLIPSINSYLRQKEKYEEAIGIKSLE